MSRLIFAAMVFLTLGAHSSSATTVGLVPAGSLRASFIATNPVQGMVDGKTGEVRGPAADLTRELAALLRLAGKVTPVNGVQGVLQAVKNGEADIGFLAYDPGRAVEVDYSQTYSLAQNTFIVLEGSPLKSVKEIDRPGTSIGVPQAIIVKKGNKALLEIVDRMLDEARSSGLIAASISGVGLVGVDVAPPRAR